MTTRLRTSLLLGLACCGLLLVGCDSDDPAETGRVDGRYVAEVDVTANATAGATNAQRQNRSRSQGGCCFTVDLDLSTDVDGDISGAGTIEYYNVNGTESAPPRDVDVTGTFEGGTVEGDVVLMTIALEGVSEQYAFEGRVSQDGNTIAGTFVGQVFGGVDVVFQRVP